MFNFKRCEMGINQADQFFMIGLPAIGGINLDQQFFKADIPAPRPIPVTVASIYVAPSLIA